MDPIFLNTLIRSTFLVCKGNYCMRVVTSIGKSNCFIIHTFLIPSATAALTLLT